MKKTIYLSLVCAAILGAAEVTIDPIAVESTELKDVSGEEIKSADVAEALAKKVPSISLVRRSGVANDIILRGQKKDNINVLIDDAKLYGACPNRMDPTTSHIVNNNIDSIEIIEGPYDVETFGTLSGAVKITTRKPTEDIHGDINLGYGSFDYKKAAATISGGTEHFKFLLSMSGENSGQYRDGDGNNFAEQIDNFIINNPAADPNVAYQDQYRDMDAYTKKTLMGKVYIDITDDQELRFGYTANRSDDVLYPSSKMDALYDDSNLYTAEYIIRDIAPFSKKLNVQYYYSDVEHPMSIKYRKSALTLGEITSALTTEVQGAKIKNLTEINDDLDLTVGFDGSVRNWDGTYYKNGLPMKTPTGDIKTSITNVDTTNIALFANLEQRVNTVNIKYGLRYDDTSVKPERRAYNATQQDNAYQALSANIFTTYDISNSLTLFGGAGKASRVPDARELYFIGSMGNVVGTDDLDQTTNYEVDLGMENTYDSFNVKTKLFYSLLKDYIYYNASNVNGMGAAVNAFENIDATIYGIEVSGSYYPLDDLYADFGVAYQRGQKDEALPGQTNTNLAEIPPLKGNVSLNYFYYQESLASVEFVGAAAWTNYDDDNGEQELPSWGVMNLKVDHKFAYGFGLTAGVDNIFDKTYAVSNTYKDLTLLSGGGDVMLMNEPGRYYYVNASYSF